MPAVIEQLPTSDDEDQPTPPTECHNVAVASLPLPSSCDQQTQPPAEETVGVAATAAAAAAAAEEQGERVVDVERCSQLKAAGNQLYNEGSVSEALVMYRRALWCAPIKPLPSRPPKSRLPKSPADGTGAEQNEFGRPGSGKRDDASGTSAAKATEDGGSGSDDEAVPEDTTDYTLTSQVYCNAGLCLMKLDVKEEAVQMLSEALRHDDKYVKAYLRRADCYYDLQKWSNAYGDYESYEKLGGVLDAQGRARKTAAKQKVDEEMQKMLGELKNIGNKILGNFGLSTDNFKFDKDPNTGGYSMRFER